jgi:hypothetical protein
MKIDVLDNYQNIKILGMNFSPIVHLRNISNFNEVLSKLKYKFSSQGYKMMDYAKRYIIIKCNFYNSLLYIKYLKQIYKDWFKRELRNWLKANLIFITLLSNKFCNRALHASLVEE